MSTNTILFCLACALGLLSVTAHGAELPPVDEAVEAMTNTVSIPTALGRITVRSCERCPERFLNLTNASKFFIGENEVPFVDLKNAISRPTPQFISVFYRDGDIVTRVVLAAP